MGFELKGDCNRCERGLLLTNMLRKRGFKNVTEPAAIGANQAALLHNRHMPVKRMINVCTPI
jgi:hypothetical protein